MNDFDDIPFQEEQAVSLENNLDELPFEPLITNEVPFNPLPTMMDENNIIVLDERIKNIPKTEDKFEDPMQDENGILIIDPRIKDVKPRNARISFTKPTILLPVIAFVFVSILGMYLFISNSKADTTNLIRVEQNEKFGYIDSQGTLITRAKYPYGSEYYKGHAIVKNDNNLYGVLNGRGVLIEPFGNYYYIGLFGDKYIASKYTKNGLKQALLNSNLDNITSFKYDSISYAKDNVYLFTRGETTGVLNNEGKEIYTFEVDEVDNKDIDIEISHLEKDDKNNRYAAIKVNESSAIINVSTGKVIYGYTLENINVLKNNVFYIKNEDADENSTYLVIKDDKIRFKSDKYLRVRIADYDSNIAIAINNDSSISYINLKNSKDIAVNKNNDYFYGSGLVLEKTHDYNMGRDIYNIISANRNEGRFDTFEPVNGEFSNKMLNVSVSNNKYNFVNKDGRLINNSKYDYASVFNENGYAIVSNDNYYGVLNKNGKEIIKLSYNNIEFLDNSIYNILKEKYNKELFVYQNENKNYGFISSDNKIVVNAIYNEIDYITDEYPIVRVEYEGETLLYNLGTNKELPIKVDTDDITIKDNYIIVGQNYYNYSGKLIFSSK